MTMYKNIKFIDKRSSNRCQAIIFEAVNDLFSDFNCMLTEAESSSIASKVTKVMANGIKDPKSVESFVEKNESKYEQTLQKMENKDKPFYKRVWNYICYAVKKGVKFIIDNFFTIIKLIAIITLAWISYNLYKKWVRGREYDILKRTKELSNARFEQKVLKKANDSIDGANIQIVDKPKNINKVLSVLNKWASSTKSAQSKMRIDQLKKMKDTGTSAIDVAYVAGLQNADCQLPKYKMCTDQQIEFLAKLPKETRQLICDWYCRNQITSGNMSHGLSRKQQINAMIDNALSIFQHAERNGSNGNAPTDYKVLRNQSKAANWKDPKNPVGSFKTFIDALQSVDDSNKPSEEWNKFIDNLKTWDKNGRYNDLADRSVLPRLFGKEKWTLNDPAKAQHQQNLDVVTGKKKASTEVHKTAATRAASHDNTFGTNTSRPRVSGWY